jgi:hypothetical protein
MASVRKLRRRVELANQLRLRAGHRQWRIELSCRVVVIDQRVEFDQEVRFAAAPPRGARRDGHPELPPPAGAHDLTRAAISKSERIERVIPNNLDRSLARSSRQSDALRMP